jgi:predicted nucleic acid-binding protein
MTDLLFDTCFLIDLEREMKRGRARAHRFLELNPNSRPCLSWIVAGEFAEGFGDIRHPACAAMLARFDILDMNEETAHQYAITTRHLRSQNKPIGANNHWIAAAALARQIPLVTNNSNQFSRIPGLSVISY